MDEALEQENKTNEKTCAHRYCDNTFVAKHYNVKYCDADHFSVCEKCGKEFPVSKKKISKNPRACSQSCASSLSHSEESREKRRENSLKKYGTEFVTQSSEMKEKIKTALDSNPDKDFRIGSENYKKQIQEKYGVENVSQLEEIKKKKIESSLKNYGVENPFQNKEIQEKYKDSMLERYGVDHPTKSDAIMKKFYDTLMTKYGTSRPHQHKIKNYSDWMNIEEWLKSLPKKPSIKEAAKYFDVHYGTMVHKKTDLDLHKYFRIVNSYKEEQFAEFLNTNFPDVRYVHNDRKLISPYEVDFYFPDHNLAVEINPTTTHHSSDNYLNYGKSSPKEKNYHLNKALACEKVGVELISLFDWMPWKKSLEMISHKLSKSSRTIYARKASVHFVEKKRNKISQQLKDFIDSSHILGFDGRGTQYYTYLEHDGEIIAVAGFGAPRKLSIKKKSDNTAKDSVENSPITMELTRLCFAPDVSVPGGASRLLKTFIKEYSKIEPNLSKIITFSDYDLGSGRIYETLGFKTIVKPVAQRHFVHPDYLMNYDSIDDDISETLAPLFTVRETSLHLAGADRLLKNLPGYEPVGLVCQCSDTFHKNAECLPSNIEIMRDNGFLIIYDCGYKKWELDLSA